VTPVSQQSGRSSATVDHLRQYNTVFYGLPECNTGIHRAKLDLDRVADVCSKINCDVPRNAIRDCIRIGKYVPNSSKPRPISTVHVANLFSKKGNYPSGIVLKHDLSYTERQTTQGTLAAFSVWCRPQVHQDQGIKHFLLMETFMPQ